MKTIKLIAAAALLGAAVACSSCKTAADKDVPASAKEILPSQEVTDSVSYLLGINFGTFIKGYGFGDKLNWNKIKEGMNDLVNSVGNQHDTDFVKQFKINPELMNRMFGDYLQKMNQYTLEVNKAKGDKFLEENAKKEGVQTTDSGLQYIIEEAGNDVKPGVMDTVCVHYVGKTIDGNIFDQTTTAGPSAELTLNRVVAGWTEGLQLIGEGGKIKLFLPAELGYGERGQQGIEPNSVLIFDVTLDQVKRFVAPEAE